MGTQPFLAYVILKKMPLAVILEEEFDLRRTYSFAMWIYDFPINPMHFSPNGHYAVWV